MSDLQRLSEIQTRLDAATPELWKPLPSSPSYDISNLGNVRSWVYRQDPTQRSKNPRLIKGAFNSAGYRTCSIWRAPRTNKTRTIHALVMEAWVGPRPKGMEVAHLNGDSHDNRLENLRYVTHLENEGHKAEHGTKALGSTVNGAIMAEWQVAEIRYLSSKGISGVDIGRLFGVSHKYVSQINAVGWPHVDPRKDADDLAFLLSEVRALTERINKAPHASGCRVNWPIPETCACWKFGDGS